MTKTSSKALTVVALPEGIVRTTPDKRVSVFDAIIAATGVKNPWQVWNRLKAQYPEVLSWCEDFKFPGRRQRLTPVTNKTGFLKLLALLPGDTAQTFRAESAQLVIRYLEGDPTLAEELIDRQEDPEVLDRLALRAKSIGVRKVFTETMQRHGAVSIKGMNTFAQCTGVLNRSVTGSTAKQIQEYTGMRKTRDALPSVYLSLMITGEELTTANIHKKQAFGHAALCQATHEVGEDLKALREKYAIADWPEGQAS